MTENLTPKKRSSLNICGTKVDFGLSMDDAVLEIAKVLESPVFGKYICTTNPEFIMASQKDVDFQKIINDSYLSLPDGIGVIYAQRFISYVKRYETSPLLPLVGLVYGVWLGISLPFTRRATEERLSGVELTYRVCEYAAEHGKTVYLLGGGLFTPSVLVDNATLDTAQIASRTLCNLYPHLHVVGATSSYGPSVSDDGKTLEHIHNDMTVGKVGHIDILLVAYGHSKQEKWILRNSNNVPARISVGVGGTFDYISKAQPYAPKCMQSLHLEWLFRLVTQPWRYKRILTAFPLFPLHIYYSYCIRPLINPK